MIARTSGGRLAAVHELEVVELSSGGNEASDLLPVRGDHILETHGWDRGFWTVLDEGPVEQCVAVIGHRRDGGWEIHPLACLPGDQDGSTEDGEACARKGEWVYVIGSHFGSKSGPLQAKRAFFARFSEAELDGHVSEERLRLEVARNSFRLHRAINDAIAGADLSPLQPGSRVRKAFIAETLDRGSAKGKKWISRISEDDMPLNIEGAAFRDSGTLLLALRFPCSDAGDPILVEIDGIEGMFDADARTWPTVRALWVLRGARPDGAIVGFRALSARGGDEFDAIVGSIDATGKGSVVLEDHPEGGDINCSHVFFRLAGREGGGEVGAEPVRDFPDLSNVEGVSVLDGHPYYVTDEDRRIALRF